MVPSIRIQTDAFTDTLFLSDSEREDFEERAAIMEYDGGLNIEEAEQYALERVIKNREVFRCAV